MTDKTPPVDYSKFSDKNHTPEQIKKVNEKLVHITGFSMKQLAGLRKRFDALDVGKKGYLLQSDFMEIRGLRINPVADRITRLFVAHGATNFETFVKTLAVFIPSKQVPPVGEKHAINSNMQKVKMLFRMYDVSHDKRINMEELNKMLRIMMGASISANTVSAIAYRTMLDTDTTGTNLINFKDFKKVLRPDDVGRRMTFNFNHW